MLNCLVQLVYDLLSGREDEPIRLSLTCGPEIVVPPGIIRKGPIPYPRNAPGDFYVEDGCCIDCGVPEAAAPDLIRRDEDGAHCYFKRQPVSAEEVDQAIEAINVACCAALRYGGKDPQILHRIDLDQCDHPLSS